MNKLPSDWQIKTLNEVCFPSNSNIAYKDVKDKKGNYPIFGASGIVAYADFYSKEKECLGIVKDGSVGKIFLLPAKSSVISTLNYLENTDLSDIKYLYYFLHRINFSKYIKGSVIPHIYFRDYNKEKIPLPPLATQKQIAERLDYLFDKIEKGIKYLKLAKENIIEYKQSMLKYAFEGKLTDCNNWEIKTLGDLYEITSSKRVFKKEWKKEGIPFYRARDIVSFSKNETLKNPLFISYNMYNEYSKKYGIPSKDDILVTGVGTIGIPYLVKENDRFYFKDGNIIWLKKRSNNIFSKYVYYLFFSNLLEFNSRGSTVLTYTIINAKNTKIPIPPIETQKEIVSILDKSFKSMDEIERLNNENINNLLLLKKSLLKEAFSGRLI